MWAPGTKHNTRGSGMEQEQMPWCSAEFSARKNSYKKQVLLPEISGRGCLFWNESITLSLPLQMIQNKNEEAAVLPRAGETVTRLLFWDFNWHEIDGKESTAVSPDLTSAVQDKQNFTDKDLKCIWLSVSHQPHIDNLITLEILGIEPLFCSIQHPDLAGFLRWRDCGLGTHPTPTARNQATSTRASIGAPPPWRCHPCEILLCYLETEMLNRASFPAFQSQNTLHGNKTQQFMQLLTFSIGQHEFRKKNGKPQASFDCWPH